MSYPQSVAYTAVFKAYLASDHVTPATGKTIAVTISKAGGDFGNPSAGASNATEISGGWYSFAFSTTDTGTLGDLVLKGAESSIDTVERIFPIVSATTGGASNLDAAVSSRSTLTQTQVTGGTYALNSASFAFNAAKDFTTAEKAATLARVTLVDTTTTNTDMLTAAAVWANGTRTLSSFGTLVADVATAVWGAAARTLTAFGFTVDTNPATLTSAYDAAKTAASASSLATLAAKFTGITFVAKWLSVIMGKTADATTLAEVQSQAASAGFDNTTDSLEAVRDRGDAAWVTGGGGSGSLTVPVHVTDDSNADVVGKAVTVRLSGSTIDISQPTDASGLTTVSVDPANDYEFIVPGGNGLNGSTTSVDVSDETTVELSVVRNAITPSTDPQTTCYLTVLDNTGQPKASIPVELRITGFATGSTGVAISVQTSKGVTDNDGLVQFAGQPQHATYELTVNGGTAVKGVTSDDTTTALVNALGQISVAG